MHSIKLFVIAFVKPVWIAVAVIFYLFTITYCCHLINTKVLEGAILLKILSIAKRIGRRYSVAKARKILYVASLQRINKKI